MISAPVLLAQVTDDLVGKREEVRRYLDQEGMRILPTQEYPQGGEAFKAAFAEDLKQCCFVVQLLSAVSDRMPPDLKIGYARHQAGATMAAGVELMQWRPLDVKVENVQDVAHHELLSGDTVTASTLEQFKSEVLHRVRRPKPVINEKPDFFAFMNAEQADLEAARKIGGALRDTCPIKLLKDGPAAAIRDDLNKKLGGCGALLLLYGQGGLKWVHDQMDYLRKACAGKPDLLVAICKGPPPGKDPVDYFMEHFDEIDCTTGSGEEWNLEPVREFLKRVAP